VSELPQETLHPWRADFRAGLVVFLVALPLCLGIAVASGAPPLSGLVAGIVGGVVVGLLSGSHTSVSGPAAGLAIIVLHAISQTFGGDFRLFLCATVLAGLMQIAFALVRAGQFAAYFPHGVVKGMLAAIGLTIVLKQLPHALGYDADPEGDFAYQQANAETTFDAIEHAISAIEPGALIASIAGGLTLLLWRVAAKRKFKIAAIPGPLAAVLVASMAYETAVAFFENLRLSSAHLVSIPEFSSISDFLVFPRWSSFTDTNVLMVATTLAVIGSVESLLALEAADRLDAQRRTSDPNRELLAQGVGNMLCGLIGGLPLASVVVRTAANIHSGARTRMGTISHGVFLLVATLALGGLINRLPLAALAPILIDVGAKLASPALFVRMWRRGKAMFWPFVATVVGVVFTDLLRGVAIGLALSTLIVLVVHIRLTVSVRGQAGSTAPSVRTINLAHHVSFLSKPSLAKEINGAPPGTVFVVDGSAVLEIDDDVVDFLVDVRDTSARRGVIVELKDFSHATLRAS
jgi:MFS superfamily sulfate permease-like transporter